MNIYGNPDRSSWKSLLQRPVINTQTLETTVAGILQEVKQGGEVAIQKLNAQFGGFEQTHLQVTEAELNEAANLVDEQLRVAINVAKENITTFHRSQRESVQVITTMPGVECWRKSLPIQKVGLYIPGGTAPLFSTLLMLGIPATLAGCSEIVVCTPADQQGNVHPAILYTAQLLGIRQVFKIGGAQAIAAMAYGTENIPQVYKIFGPGNQYVTCAKQLVSKDGVAIDMPAGPSEVAVFADETAHPDFVAADLLSQAEHGVDSQVLLVATSLDLVNQVNDALATQLAALSRQSIASQALQHSKAIVVKDVDTAFNLLNEYAPEHLIIAADEATLLAEKVTNAGSVFLGHFTPESAGDYASGTNHTLPTNGYAKAYAGVSLDSFVKKVTFQYISQQGLKNLGPAVATMAAAEGLDAHRNAVLVRNGG